MAGEWPYPHDDSIVGPPSPVGCLLTIALVLVILDVVWKYTVPGR